MAEVAGYNVTKYLFMGARFNIKCNRAGLQWHIQPVRSMSRIFALRVFCEDSKKSLWKVRLFTWVCWFNCSVTTNFKEQRVTSKFSKSCHTCDSYFISMHSERHKVTMGKANLSCKVVDGQYMTEFDSIEFLYCFATKMKLENTNCHNLENYGSCIKWLWIFSCVLLSAHVKSIWVNKAKAIQYCLVFVFSRSVAIKQCCACLKCSC